MFLIIRKVSHHDLEERSSWLPSKQAWWAEDTVRFDRGSLFDHCSSGSSCLSSECV